MHVFLKGKDPHLPDDFLSYFENPSSFPIPQQVPHQPPMSQNFHFVGGPAHYAPYLAPRPSVANGISSASLSEKSTPLTPSGLQSQPLINVDSGDEDRENRTDKRLA